MKTKLTYIVFLLSLAFYSCKKDAAPEPTDYPFVILSEIKDITSEGATLNANITDLGNQKILDYGFVLNDSIYTYKPTINNIIKSLGNNPSLGEFSYSVKNDLEKGKTFQVRAYIKTDKFIVYSNLHSFISEGCLPPVITTFYPDSGSVGRIITIIGRNFSSKLSNNKVYFGTNSVNVVKANSDTLLVQSPNTSQSYSVKIELEVAKQKTSTSSYFKIIFPWLKTTDFIGGNRYAGSSCIMGNYGYTTLGRMRLGSTYSANNLWQFSFDTKQWSQRKDFPASERYSGTSFSANGLIYFGLGFSSDIPLNDLWAYNPLTDEWDQKTNFPGSLDFSKTDNFVINDTVYLCSLLKNGTNEFFIYLPKTDTWQKQGPIIPWDFFSFSISYNNKGYLIAINGDIWQFNPNLKTCIKFGEIATDYQIYDGFCLDGIIYANSGGAWRSYDIRNGSQGLISFPGYFSPDIIFAFQNKAYISQFGLTDFWEFYPR